MKYRKVSIVLLLVFQMTFLKAQVVINEYSCSNLAVFADNNGKYEDWVELYNTGLTPVDLSGYCLSDNVAKTKKWKIPVSSAAIIPANGFLRFWVSGRDVSVGSNFHTSFKLTQTKLPKEKILFSDATGFILDSITILPNQLEHSTGRTTDGAATWSVFNAPTPLASNNTSTPIIYSERPEFDLAAGFYAGAQSLTITTTEPSSTIFYTLNGDEPNNTSAVYSAPLSISTTTTVKAIVYSSLPNIAPSFIEYGTFFINVNHTLPVVSVAASTLTELVNGDEFLLPNGTFEYFGKDKLLKTRSYGEFNKHGKDSWSCDQRAIDFIARDEMGYKYALQEKIFAATDRNEFQRIIIRASGDDNYPCGHNSANEGSAHMRDGYVQNLAKRGNMHLDVRIAERIIIYLNGAYWGVYELREIPDEHDYTKYYYDQDKYNIQCIQTWGNTWAEYGGQQALTDWQGLFDFITTQDMANPTNYDYVESKFNTKSFVDYILVNSFTVCSDWLNYNTSWWRGLDPKGDHKKWGYMLWDNDATFGFYINYTNIPDTSATAAPCNPEKLKTWGSDPEGHIKMLNKLNNNPTFHQYYVTRQADLMNSTFSRDSMINYLDEYTAIIDPEMAMHAARWNGTYTEWKANVARLRNFIERRTASIPNKLRGCYNLTGPYDLTIATDTAATVATIKLNSLEIKNFPWTGKYYGGIKNNLSVNVLDTAANNFNGWTSSLALSPNLASTEVSFKSNKSGLITAHFTAPFATPTLPPIGNQASVLVYPTAVTDEFVIDYYLPTASKVSMELYTNFGQKIMDLSSQGNKIQQGQNLIRIDLSKSELPSEIYIVKVSTDDVVKSFKIVYLH